MTGEGSPLGCRFAVRLEHLGGRLNRDGPQIAYVISDSGFQFWQNRLQFTLSLRGDGPISEQTYSALETERHS
jgi:hypothetical protein